MSGTVASKATRDALFLDRYRAIDLPYVDIAIAVLVGVAVSLYIRASRWLSLRTLQIGSLLFFAANCLTFWWLSLAVTERQRRPVHRHLPLGRAVQRRWPRRRSGRSPISCSPRARPSAPSASSAAAPFSAGSSAASPPG